VSPPASIRPDLRLEAPQIEDEHQIQQPEFRLLPMLSLFPSCCRHPHRKWQQTDVNGEGIGLPDAAWRTSRDRAVQRRSSRCGPNQQRHPIFHCFASAQAALDRGPGREGNSCEAAIQEKVAPVGGCSSKGLNNSTSPIAE